MTAPETIAPMKLVDVVPCGLSLAMPQPGIPERVDCCRAFPFGSCSTRLVAEGIVRGVTRRRLDRS